MEPQSDTPETPIENEVVSEDEVSPELPEQPSPEIQANNHAKRGKLMTSALLVTIVLTFISVLVAGIFELTGRWFRECPKELRVNDPAPALWNDMTSKRPVNVGLGVPQELQKETVLKITEVGPK